MDFESVWLSDEADLKNLGLKEKGHIIALKGFCFPESDTQKKAELVNLIKTTGVERTASAKRRKSLKEKVVSIGWKNYDNKTDKFIIVRAEKGGGTREVLFPNESTYDDILQRCTDVFFPEGMSNAGDINHFNLSLMNFKSTPIDSSFTLGEYIKEHHLTKTRIYFYTKKKTIQQIMLEPIPSESESDSDELPTFINQLPTFINPLSTVTYPLSTVINPLSNVINPPFSNNATQGPSNNISSLHSELIGNSDERLALNMEITNAYQDSLQLDSEKENKRRVEREDQNRKEELRKYRGHMVPDEPDLSCPHTVVLVRHQTRGLIKRIFPEEAHMSSVYYWVGSLSTDPENFSLCKLPGIPISPDLPVTQLRNVLCMEMLEETDQNGTLLLKDNQISTIEDRRVMELNNLPVTESQHYVRRINIIKDLLQFYKDHQDVTSYRPSFAFKEELAFGDGVNKDTFSSFYQCFFAKHFDGVDAKVPSVNIGDEECLIFGRIISHAYISFGIFPIQIAKASFMHFLTGKVSDQDLFDSFTSFLDSKEGELVKRVVRGEDELFYALSDILADYRINAIINKENAYGLVISAAKNVFLRYPCFSFQKICEGMGNFWKDISREDIKQIYNLAVATPETVLERCEIDERDKLEAKCATWFCRYVRCCTSEMLGLLLRFCTGSSHLIPTTKIKVTWSSQTGESNQTYRENMFTNSNIFKKPSNFSTIQGKHRCVYQK